jgi:hypothetical protein
LLRLQSDAVTFAFDNGTFVYAAPEQNAWLMIAQPGTYSYKTSKGKNGCTQYQIGKLKFSIDIHSLVCK